MERRFIQLSEPMEVREKEDGGATVSGYAAVYYRSDSPGTEFELFEGVKERIVPGAFDRAMGESQDVRALFNHDPNMLLGRTSAGTLRLDANRRGLRYEIDLPNTTAGKDVRESIARGDLSGSSFGFIVRGEKWSTTDDQEIREITDVDLYDVGPVTYPAYTATSSGLRDEFLAECRSSLDAWQEHKQRERDEKEREWQKCELIAQMDSL